MTYYKIKIKKLNNLKMILPAYVFYPILVFFLINITFNVGINIFADVNRRRKIEPRLIEKIKKMREDYFSKN